MQKFKTRLPFGCVDESFRLPLFGLCNRIDVFADVIKGISSKWNVDCIHLLMKQGFAAVLICVEYPLQTEDRNLERSIRFMCASHQNK